MTKHIRTTRPSARKAALLLASSVIAATPVAAQSQWDGSDNSDYSDPDNWSTGVVPGAGSTAVVDTTTNAPVVTGSPSLGNLIIGQNGTGQMTVGENSALIFGLPFIGNDPHSLSIGGVSGSNASGGNGTLLVVGPGIAAGGGQTLSVGVGSGTLALDIGVGAGTTGLLDISNGGSVFVNNTNVGRAANSSGTINVSGTGSLLTIDSSTTANFGNANIADLAGNPIALGFLNVTAGGAVVSSGTGGWALGPGSRIDVSGSGSSIDLGTATLTSHGAVTVAGGGVMEARQLIGQDGADLTVTGTGSRFTTELFLMAQGNNSSGGSLLVEAGGQLTTNGFGFASNGTPAEFTATVQGAGTRWTINAGGGQNLGAGTNQVDFRVLDGAVVDSTASNNNWSIGQGTSILVSGAGSQLLSGGVFNLNATTIGEPVGDFIIENGGEVTISASTLSALGSIGGPVSRSLVVRSGGQLNFTGGSGAGLSVRNGTILVDGGTLTGRLELAGEEVRRTTVTVQGGGLIDGTGGGAWSTNSGVDFLVTGASSRLIAVGAPVVGGDVTVSAGGNASFEAIDLGSSTRTSALTISGANSQFTTGDFFVSRFNDFNADVLVENGARLVTGRVLVGTNSNNSVVNLTVTGAGSLWQVTSDATALDFGAGAADVSLFILDGGRFQSLSAINPSFRPNTDVLISGVGSTFETVGNISFGGASAGQPVGTIVIENGGSLFTRGPSDNGLGFNGVLRTMSITNGSSWIMTGGLNSGLQIETTELLVDNSTLSAEGAVSIGQRFSGTDLILRNSDFTARALNVGSVAGNQVTIGTRADGTAGGAGAFNVASLALTGGNTLEVNHTESDFVLPSSISGAGTINHLAGTTLFTGGQGGFSGLLDVTGGEVVINGTLGGSGARATFADARLSGTGTFGGDVTLGNATLAPGNSPGTFTIGGDLVLGASSVLDFELGLPDQAPGVGSDLIVVDGDLTLDGTLDITDIGGFGGGLYRLITYGGALTDNGLNFGTLPANFDPAELTLSLATAGQVNLIAAASETDFIFWDGAQAAANSLIDGGSGTWDITGTNWTIADGSANGAYDPADFLIFTAPTAPPESASAHLLAAVQPSASTGMVMVDNSSGQVSLANGVQFATTGYTVTGGAIRLDSPGVLVRVGDGSSTGADFAATIDSALIGTGGLTKTDLGTLIVTGPNTYSGDTQVQAGTLQGNATSLQGAIDVAAGGTLLFDQTADGAYAGGLTGSGAFVKEGAGMLTLSGDSADYLGRAELAQGGLDITGTLGQDLGNSLLVTGAGTTLTGNGSVGNLMLGGTLSPGTGAATFSVAGDVTFHAGSNYLVDLGMNGATDLVDAGGDVLIEGGTVAVSLLDPELSYTDGSTFVIARAGESLAGSFAGIVENSAFLDFTLGYTADTAFLTLDLARQFPDVALTFNQRQASVALTNFDQSDGDALTVYNALLMLDADSARQAFDLASGEIYANLLTGGLRATREQLVTRQFAGALPGEKGWNLWLAGGLSDGHVDGDGNGARFTRNGNEVELGIEYHGPDNRWTIGISGGWQQADADNPARASSADYDGLFASAFARYGKFGSGLTASLTGSWSDGDATVARAIAFPGIARITGAEVDHSTVGLSLDVRWGLAAGQFAVGPAVGVDHARAEIGAYAENGAGALDLAGAGASTSSTRLSAGGFASWSASEAVVVFDVRYVAGEEDDSTVAHRMAGSPQSFTVLPARGSASGARLTGLAAFNLGGGLTVGASAGAYFAGEESDVNARVELRYAF